LGLDIAKEKFSIAVGKVKKLLPNIVGNTREKKLEIILDNLIDSIELRGNDILIKTKKNIAIQNEGHLVQINSGSHVMLSKEIHLNPNIKIDPNDGLANIQNSLDEQRRIEEIKLLEDIEKTIEKNRIDCDCNN